MAYKKLWRGTYGGDVRELQRRLNEHGYGLDVDGGFGQKTYAAVVDYQKRRGLAVDGVVGQETWGSLLKSRGGGTGQGGSTGKEVLSGVSDETADRLAQLEQGYKPSEEVLAAEAEKQSVEAMGPGAYQSSFDEQLEALYREMTGQEPFSYDPEEDGTYHRLAGMYRREGLGAMEDTLGRASALSGGYDSSYARMAGQQAYQQYLQELAALVPQLEHNARRGYEAEGQALQKRYEELEKEKGGEYRRWKDEQAAWQDSVEQAQRRFEDLRGMDYKTYSLLLRYFQDKAAAEQKASGGVRANSGRAAEESSRKPSLSSTAADSLERAMGNYLKGGQPEAARELAAKYAGRMTPAQKKKIAGLFEKYGMAMAV